MNELQYLIDNYFQSLKTEKIKLNFHKEKDSFAYTKGFPRIGYTISFSKKDYKKMTENQIKGVLSHELAHILYDQKRGPIFTAYGNIIYLLSDKYKSKEERKVDKLIIDVGCGNYLLEFMKYHDRIYKKYNKTDGLTKKEIKGLLLKKIEV